MCDLLFVNMTRLGNIRGGWGGGGGGGAALPYMSYIGMCRCEGMVFKQCGLE